MNAFVTSHLDYGNSLLYGINKTELNKLQLVQNAAARVIDKKLKYDHITQTRKDLHWLPIEARIKFKILCLTWQALNVKKSPGYLQDLIKRRKKTNHNVRNNDKNLLRDPDRNKYTKYGDRAFQHAAPKLWNVLPSHIQDSEDIKMFKKKLKTHLFEKYYET